MEADTSIGETARQLPLSMYPNWDDDPTEDVNDFQKDNYYFADNEPHSYDVIAGEVPDAFYVQWEAEVSHATYAGVHLDDETLASLFSIITGCGGYFMLVGAVTAREHDISGVSSRLAANALAKSRIQMEDIVNILDPVLDAAGIPWDRRRQKIDEILKELRERFSGDENSKVRKEEKLRLGIGRTALRRAS